jgi:hypothetical protein
MTENFYYKLLAIFPANRQNSNVGYTVFLNIVKATKNLLVGVGESSRSKHHAASVEYYSASIQLLTSFSRGVRHL